MLLCSGVNEFSQVPGRTSDIQTNKKKQAKEKKKKKEGKSESRIILMSPGAVPLQQW